jgi:hypothetical protein
MLLTILLLATLMAILGVVGYFQGVRAAFFMTLMILFGMLLIERAGGGIAKLINGLYFGIRFVLSGGVQALGSGGSAAISQAIQQMGPVKPLLDPNSPGPELLVVLLIVILLSWWLGRVKRLPLRGSSSGWGILWGLLNGYILGAYLLWSLAPSLADSLPVPFKLGTQTVPATGAPAAGVSAAQGTSLTHQLIAQVQTANEGTLAAIVMILIAVFVIVTAFVSTRGGGRSRRNGTN